MTRLIDSNTHLNKSEQELAIPKERVVMCEITFLEMLNMLPPVPYEVQLRNKLHSHGFEFEDDGKPSLIVNLNPKPLGKFSCHRDYVAGVTYCKQILNT